MKFFDRADELAFFEGLTKRKSKKMVALFGRRRIGKTTLLKKVYPNARYFFVDTRSSETLLKDFSSEIFEGSFDNWEGFFRALLRLHEVVIFDEFQNFMKVDQSVFSVLQKVWDENFGRGLLILCGSYVGMMKRIFLDQKAPLFGRCDHKIELSQFRFNEALEMIRSFGYSFEEAVEWYSVLGGVPQYLWLLEEKAS
ncbi:MAG: ATP-binding protein, partial [Kosmotogaceae bacterium]|nr:ATP-binding protein [Kosmotogaceae bacterium]